MKRNLIIASIFLAACGSQVSAQKGGVFETNCSGLSKQNKFLDKRGVENVYIDSGINIKIYRESSSPELDWVIHDNYLFNKNSGDRLEFSRSIIFASQPYAYVQIAKDKNPLIDNLAALPEGIYIPEQEILGSLQSACSLSPV